MIQNCFYLTNDVVNIWISSEIPTSKVGSEWKRWPLHLEKGISFTIPNVSHALELRLQ
jgi:hypothetical protein